MALKEPFAAYNAANNVEAELIRNALVAAGIEAHLTEHLSVVGGWAFGLLPEIHKPQVWIERADVDRAGPVLAEFERRAAELRAAPEPLENIAESTKVVCEECGGSLTFPSTQKGSVQTCTHCGAFVDVGDEEELEGWNSTDGAEDEPKSSQS
jgi:hypothetical protein